MTPDHQQEHVLAGDIGATKTNLGLFVPAKLRPKLTAFEQFSSLKFGGLKEIIEKFLERHAVPISSVCFGIAGPVAGGKSKTTNLEWSVSERALTRHFGWPRVKIVNDLTAAGHSKRQGRFARGGLQRPGRRLNAAKPG
ncbi:MAG: glucokinase [Desulfobacterales bacterium]|uniref:Glucokinase n=1 Tax=Candidatus Desulfatibia profunda TaxID=2841695 RepID=A0A8J6NQX6_9BACT|nr:glucokinase [Candidatus Desulfatibia profunda]MBL7179030.1 glucokinase [Desulfobacterales bacterium]MBU0698276.1 glucokinase [Pseudomonadota bacterium]